MSSFTHRHHVYLFTLANGKKKLAYGGSPEEALEILGYRLSPEEMGTILKDQVEEVHQRDLMELVKELG